jgi:hypothetical protein
MKKDSVFKGGKSAAEYRFDRVQQKANRQIQVEVVCVRNDNGRDQAVIDRAEDSDDGGLVGGSARTI